MNPLDPMPTPDARPLFVGEVNPYQDAEVEEFALYPSPPGCAGWRLCRVVLDMDPDDYVARFTRANLCSRRWSMPAARVRARELLVEHPDVPLVLLGAKVAAAFGLDFAPFTRVGARSRWVILPRPSGRSTLWNEPGAVDRARAVLRGAGVLP